MSRTPRGQMPDSKKADGQAVGSSDLRIETVIWQGLVLGLKSQPSLQVERLEKEMIVQVELDRGSRSMKTALGLI